MYNIYAEFPRQQICKDRQYSGLLRWSGAVITIPIPTEKPEETWVEQRIVAVRVPNQINTYVEATMSWVIRDNDIQTNIRQHLNAFNNEATEAAMDQNVDMALGRMMPLYCHSIVSQGEVDQWYNENGFGEPATSGAVPGGADTGGNPPPGRA